MRHREEEFIGGYEDEHLANARPSDAMREAFEEKFGHMSNEDEYGYQHLWQMFCTGYQAAIAHERRLADELVDVRLLNDAITLITKSLAAMLTDTTFASPYIEDHRPRVPRWVMTHFRHDHDRRIQYVNDIRQRLDWIRNATAKVRAKHQASRGM